MKLADFGVASTAAAGANDLAVVGSPYWSKFLLLYRRRPLGSSMLRRTVAPEVIEQSGATTASDIW